MTNEKSAERPIFVPMEGFPHYKAIRVNFRWRSGLSLKVKQENVVSLHAAAREHRPLALFDGDNGPLTNILEVSSKSPDELGVMLSAFKLQFVEGPMAGRYVESVYQASKVFDDGGPFPDLMDRPPIEAKRDQRLKTKGRLRFFQFEGMRWYLHSEVNFYDWLYINALVQHNDKLDRLMKFHAFSDIEFNPKRSHNTQARSCAIAVSLMRWGGLDEFLAYRPRVRKDR